MFLVSDQHHGVTDLVFTWQDPRKHGYTGDVIENVTLDYDMEAVHHWPDGHAAPEVCVGRAVDDPKRFKVFKYSKERQSAGFQSVAGTPLVFGAWSDYVRLRLSPPSPEQTDDERWYEYLEKLDDDAHRRRAQGQRIMPPSRGNRDEVAAWLARKHLITDNGIREVWYLPRGAPPDEIRLLELNDRIAGSESTVEAIDFGLDVEGARFRLVVADVTSDQLETVQLDPSRLPPGWVLDEKRIWTRRGA